MSPTLDELLDEARRRGASDLHLVVSRPPLLRVNGLMETLPRLPLEAAELALLLDRVLSAEQRALFARWHRLCFSYIQPRLGHSRINLYTHLGRAEAAIRLGREGPATLAELGVPEVLLDLVRRPSGLVLVTGPAGVGKTTTMNALIARINQEDRKKVITIEDPVELLHPPGRSVVVQQEVGLDTESFSAAVIHALRQDPDILVIGEMRDLDTISTALTAAETGHLVLATLHTVGAAGTVSRILDVFPADQQQQVRTQLASALAAVFSQRLLPRASGAGRILVYELLIANDAVRNLIREGKPHQLRSVLQTGTPQGMRLMDTMIRDAYAAGEITWETAVSAVTDRRALQ